MENKTFDEWLGGLDLGFWGNGMHKITPAQFFDRRQNESVELLDVRSRQEVEHLALPFAMHIPVCELPERWQEVPTDRLVVTFCSSAVRAVVAWNYLQLHGLDNVYILDGGYAELTAELKPGKVHKRAKK